MWNAGEGLGIGLCRADIEPAIHLAGVGGDHRDRRERGERRGDGCLADAGGAYKNWGQGLGIRYAQTDVPALPLVAEPCWADREHHARVGWR